MLQVSRQYSLSHPQFHLFKLEHETGRVGVGGIPILACRLEPEVDGLAEVVLKVFDCHGGGEAAAECRDEGVVDALSGLGAYFDFDEIFHGEDFPD